MPNENIWHPRGTFGTEPNPDEAGWVLGDNARELAEKRNEETGPFAVKQSLREPQESPPPVKEAAPEPPKKTRARRKTEPTSAPKKSPGRKKT